MKKKIVKRRASPKRCPLHEDMEELEDYVHIIDEDMEELEHYVHIINDALLLGLKALLRRVEALETRLGANKSREIGKVN